MEHPFAGSYEGVYPSGKISWIITDDGDVIGMFEDRLRGYGELRGTISSDGLLTVKWSPRDEFDFALHGVCEFLDHQCTKLLCRPTEETELHFAVEMTKLIHPPKKAPTREGIGVRSDRRACRYNTHDAYGGGDTGFEAIARTCAVLHAMASFNPNILISNHTLCGDLCAQIMSVLAEAEFKLCTSYDVDAEPVDDLDELVREYLIARREQFDNMCHCQVASFEVAGHEECKAKSKRYFKARTEFVRYFVPEYTG